MRIVIARSVIVAAAAAFASAALAQQPAPPPQESQSPPPRPAIPPPEPQEDAPDVSDSQLDTFTTIYADMQVLNEDFQAELAEVDSEEEAVEIQARLQEATTELFSEHDWSLDQYNQVARAINAQPDVLERALELIDEKT